MDEVRGWCHISWFSWSHVLEIHPFFESVSMCKSPSFAGEMPHSPVRPFYRKLVRSHTVNGYHQHNPCTLNFQRRSPPSLKRTAREGKLTPVQMESLQKKRSVSWTGAFRPMFRCYVWLFVSGRVYLEWDLGGDNCSWLFYWARAPSQDANDHQEFRFCHILDV